MSTKVIQSCADFEPTYRSTMKTLVLFVSVIWGLFLWDILGDEIGLFNSSWIFVVIVVIGGWIYFQEPIVITSFEIPWQIKNSDANSNSQTVATNTTLHAVANPLLKAEPNDYVDDAVL